MYEFGVEEHQVAAARAALSPLGGGVDYDNDRIIAWLPDALDGEATRIELQVREALACMGPITMRLRVKLPYPSAATRDESIEVNASQFDALTHDQRRHLRPYLTFGERLNVMESGWDGVLRALRAIDKYHG